MSFWGVFDLFTTMIWKGEHVCSEKTERAQQLRLFLMNFLDMLYQV